MTSAGMYFLHFQVYRMDSTVNAVCKFVCSISFFLFFVLFFLFLFSWGNFLYLFFLVILTCCTLLQLAMAKDPEAAFFKRLEGLQPCEVSELKPGTHIFAVYGLDNIHFFFIICLLSWAIFLELSDLCIMI